MKRLLQTVHVLAICGAIAVMAWTKSRGMTVVIPYVPHARRRSMAAVALVSDRSDAARRFPQGVLP